MAARSLHGETILPSSSSLPDPTTPPQNEPAAGASRFDRMESELKTLQSQAQATQQSLKKLQTREPIDPYTAILAELPSANTVDSMVVGVASGLLLALVALWWYLWRRPQARLHTGTQHARPATAPASLRGPLTEPTTARSRSASASVPLDSQPWDPSIASEQDGFDTAASPFGKSDPGVGFDPEAAAGEVMRVRKSLAEKRVARAHLNDHDGNGGDDSQSGLDLELEIATQPPPPADPDLDLDLDLGEPEHPPVYTQTPLTSASSNTTEPPASPADAELDLDLDPWRMPGEGGSGAADAALLDAISFSLPSELGGQPAPQIDPAVEAGTPDTTPLTDASPQWGPEPMETGQALPSDTFDEQTQPPPQAPTQPVEAWASEPAMVPAAPPATTTAPLVDQRTVHDYTVTLELAQESAALGLWAEARDMATEVLTSNNISLVSEAQQLLERVQQTEDDANQDTIPWDPPR